MNYLYPIKEMPSVKYDMGDLAGLVGAAPDAEKLKKVLPMMGMDLESIDGTSLSAEIFPNRPDLLNIEGFARALKGFLGIETGLRHYEVAQSDIVLKKESSVDDIRPAFGACIIRNLDMDDYTVKSVMDMQEKLHLTHGRNRLKVAIGIHDLDRIDPPIIYRAVKPDSVSFVPLEMSEDMSLGDILKKHPKGREYAWCLQDKRKYPIFCDSKDNVLSFPPIINSQMTRLVEGSKNLFLELTGTDQKAVNQALSIIACALADRGGRLESVRVETVDK